MDFVLWTITGTVPLMVVLPMVGTELVPGPIARTASLIGPGLLGILQFKREQEKWKIKTAYGVLFFFF
jgi:hypothetical protein